MLPTLAMEFISILNTLSSTNPLKYIPIMHVSLCYILNSFLVRCPRCIWGFFILILFSLSLTFARFLSEEGIFNSYTWSYTLNISFLLIESLNFCWQYEKSYDDPYLVSLLSSSFSLLISFMHIRKLV